MKDVTKELIPELVSLVEEFKKLDELHTAVAAENEECAKLAERNPFAQALDIAFAIRARIAKDKS